MKASDVMARRPATVRPEDSLARAATAMRTRDCGSVVVLDPRRVPIAMLTDRDICLAALRTGRALADLQVREAMSRKLFTCGPNDELSRVEDMMSLHQVRRLPVVDLGGRLLGVVSLDDIAKAARHQAGLIAPAVPASDVGRTLGDIVRPRFDPDQAGTTANEGLQA